MSIISINEIANSNPVLIVYPAGTGGEFISSVIANIASNTFHRLNSIKNHANRYSTCCPIDYYSNWADPNDMCTSLNPNFIKHEDGKRYLIKEHPITGCIEHYKKHMPEIKVIYIAPFYKPKYFSKLIFLKSAVKIKTPIDKNTIYKYLGTKLSDERILALLAWANSYTYLWVHDLYTYNTCLSNCLPVENIKVNMQLSAYITEHANNTTRETEATFKEYKKNFKNPYLINCDSLMTDGAECWSGIKAAIPEIDVDLALAATKPWIEANNNLILKYDYGRF